MSTSSFGEFIRLCARRSRLLSIIAAASFLVVFLIVYAFSTVKYETTTSIMINSNSTAATLSDQNIKEELTSKTAAKCIDIIQNSTAVGTALEREKLDYKAASFTKNVSVVQTNESSVLRITVLFPKDDIGALSFTKTLADVACETIELQFAGEYTAKELEQATIRKTYSRFFPAFRSGLAALIIGLLGFSVWQIISLSLDKTIHTHDKITKFAKKTVIASIPSKTRSHNDVQNSNRISNAYRILRSAVKYAEGSPKSIAICSPSPKDGRTSVAVGLATALAETNAMVLLIEADMRRPSVKMQMRIDSPFGLADLLLGKTNLATTICKTSNRNLYVITASNSSLTNVDIADLLDSAIMDELLEAVYDQFDYIIIDTPAVEIVPDATSISGKVDCCVVVAQYGHTRSDELSSTIEMLEGTGADVLGVVTVNSPVRSGFMGSVSNYYSGEAYSPSRRAGFAGRK
ncbi:MAG: polysaccharide biosynthesis tyrosine autokinase [Clostridia bacterium]|nr:polysaccharide biosynthesis tyrosine autokinase [Clostridia bacterium]